MNPTTYGADEELLVAALRRERGAWNQLENRFKPYLTAIIRRRTIDLPKDLYEDVVQEVWLELTKSTVTDFDPSRVPARRYISRLLLNAIRVVMANNRPPLERSRVRRYRRPPNPLTPYRTTRIPKRTPDCAELADPSVSVELRHRDARIDIDRILQRAPDDLRTALTLLLSTETSVEKAAATIGMKRSTFRRRMIELAQMHLAA